MSPYPHASFPITLLSSSEASVFALSNFEFTFTDLETSETVLFFN